MELKRLFDLSGKTALVTGCSRGIGLSMVQALAAAGADVIGVSASLDPKDSAAADKVRTEGRRFFPYRADLSDRAGVYELVALVLREHPQVDILVNNAGSIRRKPAAEYPDEYWDPVISLNLDTPFILAREFGKPMLERRKGKILFTCSLLSFQGGLFVPAYAASKGALASLVKALANEWAGKGVCVNGIVPGYIETDNTEPLRNDPFRNEAILARIPAGRWGTPDDLRGAVIFLASEASDYVHGTLLTVDGGWMGR